MRTKDIISLLNNKKYIEVCPSFSGNAIYSRSCKVRLPNATKSIPFGNRKSDIATDYLKVNISTEASLISVDIDNFLDELRICKSFERTIDWLDETTYSNLEDITYFDYSSPWEIHNAMEIDLSSDDPSHQHEHLSHYLEDDKHTFTPKEGDLEDYEYKYVDNWVEFDGTKVRLEESGEFKKWIRKEGNLSSYAEDPFTFLGFADDKEKKHELYIGEKIVLNEKSALRLAEAYCND